jgi:2-dehydro-3-deoxyphosphogluconate aldolase / (4S)-4-hydroxy-2-oxoglutarate aldolase
MDRQEVRARIEQIGIIPAVRATSAEGARYAGETICQAGIPIAEITMTVPGAVDVISHLAKKLPSAIIGAGTIMDAETAQKCLDAGARFLTSPTFEREVVEFALKHDVVVFPGALTPSEVYRAWKAGSDFVKVFPCAQVGGEPYIRALKAPFPQIRLIASGGVNQQTIINFFLSGATAVGIGGELMPKEAIQLHQDERIHELARRFLAYVHSARTRLASMKPPAAKRK